MGQILWTNTIQAWGQPMQKLVTYWCVDLALTWVKRRCLREILWFLGFTDSLCLAAVLSRHGAHCGTASRLIDSMVPVGWRTLLDLGDLRGGLCTGACWLASWTWEQYLKVVSTRWSHQWISERQTVRHQCPNDYNDFLPIALTSVIMKSI